MSEKIYLATVNYVDEQIAANSSKVVNYTNSVIATEGQTVFDMGIETYDPASDLLDVYINKLHLQKDADYTVSDGVVTLVEGVPEGYMVIFSVIKNVPTVNEEETISGSILAEGSVSLSKLSAEVSDAIANAGSKKYMTVVTLYASDWADGAQTVSVEGILADETAQSVSVTPYGSIDNIEACSGIYCTGQAENALTFTASEVPSTDVKFVVKFEEVVYIAPPA